MTDFREFYVPQGAGRNFLASKCLLTETSTNSNELNEITAKDLVRIKKFDDDGYKFDDEDMISESIKMKSVLIELDKQISKLDGVPAMYDYCRSRIIDNPSLLWRNAYIYDLSSGFFHMNRYTSYDMLLSDISRDLKILIVQVQDYFAKCREYFYNECERNDYVSFFLITHIHLRDSVSPRLKFPETFKTLVMKFDSETDMMTRALNDIKHNDIPRQDIYHPVFEHNNDLFLNRSVKFSDDSVSYRKIFIENNEDEIRKMYDFFDNEDCFEENKTNIMKEFKEYHDNNMIVIKDFMPLFYERIQ